MFLESTSALATSGMTCTCNEIVATDYLQQCNRNGYHSKAYEILIISVKTV